MREKQNWKYKVVNKNINIIKGRLNILEMFSDCFYSSMWFFLTMSYFWKKPQKMLCGKLSGKFNKILKTYFWRSSLFSYRKVAGCRFPTLLKINPCTGIFRDIAEIISCISQNKNSFTLLKEHFLRLLPLFCETVFKSHKKAYGDISTIFLKVRGSLWPVGW